MSAPPRTGRVDYAPSGYGFVRRGLRGLPVTPEDVFVDIGCGRGRVLHQAARYPFRRVIGVEISEELSREARANLARSRHRHACPDVQVITADVRDWRLPDDVSFFYTYNPVSGALFDRVVELLEQSRPRRSPRTARRPARRS